ncbi:bacterial regulatory s, crp family protein [Burkholderia pseudomallei MSHR7527]|uniref:fumarate/nitrate reduction transcriptional regulator Fnr n=1 Tax=Burkholderia pseudomallei TaxID=28450 RepID=UPI0005317426|nr:fumarate/nitrate reduction transcriptional regulator Fnr [Burkholderia pseudomallei]KGS67538.1 bacterial regulatory s, crp family protein [Burkholderia pseudomallei MSHR7527]
MLQAQTQNAYTPAQQRVTVPLRAAKRDDAAKRAAARCSSCAMRSVCMPVDLNTHEFAKLDALICSTRQVKRGDTLFRTNDGFQSIYAVRTGSFKTVVMHRDGQEHVTGFQIVGETLGLDGVCAGHHNSDAVALEDSTVCIIPFAQLEAVCREVKPMQHHVHRLMSGEIVRESSQMMLLGTMTAEQRVAAFLLNISERFQKRGYSAAEFNLRMTREEIGCYLGMKLETVSRMLSKFQRDKLIAPRGKQIRIIDPVGLARV